MKKLNEKDIRRYFESQGYKMIGEYKNYLAPITVEKDGYKAQISYGHLKEGNSPILFGKRCPFWKDNIKKFLSINAPDVEFIDVKSYKKSGKIRTVVYMKCKCGKKFEKTWTNIYNNKYILCSQCAMKSNGIRRKKNKTKEYLKNINKRGYSLVNKNQILCSNTYVEVIENSTGYKGFIYPNNNKNMIIFSLLVNKKNYIHNMNVYAKNHGINSRAICFNKDGKWGAKTIVFKCECNEYFETNERGITKSKVVCDKCASVTSSYERKVQSFLEDNNINYIAEFRFNSCKDIYPLPFDFYLQDYNCLIEVDGEQHFMPVKFGKMTDKQSEIRLKDYKRRDKIKNDYCDEYNIPLLRINYKEMLSNEYKEKILKFIQTAQK